ncbi:TPA: hypothetical protein JA969_11960 [Legionella pneumophila]|uniref:hypothetical protein n=1 Tax=Legionella pneumophila TaxID=446 RepID=UPI001A1A7FD9|nr:hypothetical protein [Legionella pneumophila]MCZ4786711.1 hypothetical protein [Legionella pneumophila]HAT8564340.1 hypothetical protein [Legionella pneumophila]HAT8583733.1 hypothetical protein [Legionella pneumophila]
MSQGIERVYWKDIRDAFYKVAPEFTSKVDLLSPDENYPLYVLSFPFGSIIGDDKSQFIPNENGSFYRLNSSETPKDIFDDIGYGADSSPLGMVLTKSIEFFVDLPEKNRTIPIAIMNPGNFFNFTRVLSEYKPLPYAPNGLLNATAGARTIFSLPYLTCNTSFRKLEREVGVLSKIPSSPYDHWQLFKDIVNSSSNKGNWNMQLIYFSKKWVDSILHDTQWNSIKSFLFQLAWKESEYTRNQYYFDIAYSLMQEKGNFTINPYLTDTARHVLDIVVAAYPGLAPITNDNLAPLKLLQHTLTYSYGLKKYIPTIIAPQYFSLNNSNTDVYYSMQYPTTRSFSPKTQNTISTLKNLEDLNRIIEKFKLFILRDDGIWEGSILQNKVKNTGITYVHTSNGIDISLAQDIVQEDSRFNFFYPNCAPDNAMPANTANFFRGCIKLSTTEV